MIRTIILGLLAIILSGCRPSQPPVPGPNTPARLVWIAPKSAPVGAGGKAVREAAVQAIKDLNWTLASEMKTPSGGAIEATSPSGELVRIRFQANEGGASTNLSIEATAGTPATTRDEFLRRIEELALSNPAR